MRIRSFALIAVLAGALSACAAGFEDPDPVQLSCTAASEYPAQTYSDNLPQKTYGAVDRLIICASPEISSRVPIVVSSITDSRLLDRTSTFGNMIADLVRSRLAQKGMTVSDPRLRSTMLLKKDQGEMMMARDPRSLVTPPTYSAILTGTYGVGESEVFVSLKLLQADSGRIISAADFMVGRDGINNLLGDSAVAMGR
jgi:TolB-like protein